MSAISFPSSREKHLLQQFLRALLVAAVLSVLALVALLAGYEIAYSGHVYPGISVGGVDLSGMTRQEASALLSQRLDFSQHGRIVLRDGEHLWQASPAQLGFFVDPETSALHAYQIGRQGNVFLRLYDQFVSWFEGVNLAPILIYDQRTTQSYLLELAKQIDEPVIEANLGLQGAEVVVHSGQVGRTLDVNASLAAISKQVQTLQDGIVPLVIVETPPVILDADVQAEAARRILSAPLTLSIDGDSGGQGPWTFDPATLANMLSIQRVQDGNSASYQVGLNAEDMRAFLTDLAPKLARGPQNARFTFNDQTRQLDLIQHAVTGRSLNVESTLQNIDQALEQGNHNVALVFDTQDPQVTDSATADQLGIHELIMSQTSYFRGSAPERIQNIKAAASSFHGLLVAPGEEFSMANALGDISLDNGYAEALIIVGDQTITGVGGGVCQVSTTLFRTVFFAGFPVNERHPHAYRVSYYEQKAGSGVDPSLAGLDATVFVPLVDFKFTNDTPYWLLMETYVDGYSLTWKFYSTSDGRSVDWHTTGVTNVVPAPPPLYKENPDLAKGDIKQVDWAAEGADVTVTRTVTRDGAVYLQDKFFTQYEPWQAKYEYGPGTENIPTPEPTP